MHKHVLRAENLRGRISSLSRFDFLAKATNQHQSRNDVEKHLKRLALMQKIHSMTPRILINFTFDSRLNASAKLHFHPPFLSSAFSDSLRLSPSNYLR